MIKKICLLLSMTLLLTGCMKVETDLTINKDGSAVVKNRFLMKKQFANMKGQGGETPLESAMKQYQNDPDSTAVPIETEDMAGMETTTKIKDLNDDSSNTTMDTQNFKTKNPDKKFVSIKKGFFKTVYKIDSEADMVTKQGGTDKLSQSQTDMSQALMGSMDMDAILKVNYIIRPPVKPDSHNASIADTEKLIYTWNLKNETVNSIQMQFTVYNTANIVITVILLLIAGLIGYVYYTNTKKTASL